MPDACSPADVERFRREGFSDRDMLGLAATAAYQNKSSRIMESLSTMEQPQILLPKACLASLRLRGR